MILGVGQLREVRPYMAPRDLAVLGDDVPPFVDWDLARVEDLGLPLAAQLALAGGSEIADLVGLAIWGNQIAALADLDGNNRDLARLTSAAANDGEGGDAAGAHPHCQRIGQVPGEGWWLQICHGDPFGE